MADYDEDTQEGLQSPIFSGNEDKQTKQTTITRVVAHDSSGITKLPELLNETNWVVWHERMTRVLRLCGVEEYVLGTVPNPRTTEDFANWKYNDSYTQVLLMNNISGPEVIQIGQSKSA
jgi:hypothetical protein